MAIDKYRDNEVALDTIGKEDLPPVDPGVPGFLTRVAVCLCLDTSGSMSGERIRKLQAGLEHFKEDLKNDRHAFMAADLSIVTFDSHARVVLPFTPMKDVSMPLLATGGMTSLGEGVLLALDQLEQRKAYYKANGISYNRPMLFIISDGCDNGDKSKTIEAKKLIAQYEREKKVTAFGINVDDKSAISELTDLTGKQALPLDSKNYALFFEWLSNSVSTKSQAKTDTISLPAITWIG